MLWTKAWLETRWRFLFAVAAPLVMFGIRLGGSVPLEEARGMINATSFIWTFAAIFLAGDGIHTQPAFQATKGLHGSLYFTLSLPVSRFRLVTVRALVGLLETAVVNLVLCAAAWAAFPVVRASSTPFDLAQFLLTTFLCCVGFYGLSVLLATFLDDVWRVWIGIVVLTVLRWAAGRMPPASFDVFRAMTDASPLVTHTMPWAAISVSLGAAAILFLRR